MIRKYEQLDVFIQKLLKRLFENPKFENTALHGTKSNK